MTRFSASQRVRRFLPLTLLALVMSVAVQAAELSGAPARVHSDGVYHVVVEFFDRHLGHC